MAYRIILWYIIELTVMLYYTILCYIILYLNFLYYGTLLLLYSTNILAEHKNSFTTFHPPTFVIEMKLHTLALIDHIIKKSSFLDRE